MSYLKTERKFCLRLKTYRNLRENCEFRLRYDEAGKFFIREMELKRKYREVLSPNDSIMVNKMVALEGTFH